MKLDPRFDPAKLTIPPLHPIQDVKPSRHVLANGLVLYLLRDPEVPLVTVQALVRTGAVLSALLAITLFVVKEAGRAMDRFAVALGVMLAARAEVEATWWAPKADTRAARGPSARA